MPAERSNLLEALGLTAREVARDDVARLHELTVGVGWPHRPDDIRMLIEIGRGYVACDEIGRVIGSAMWFPMGERAATVGMVVTSPRLQARGAGRGLMERVLADAAGREIRLNATAQGLRLYERAGFAAIGAAFQRQGEARAPGPAPLPAGLARRRACGGDLAAIAGLDRAATGMERGALLAKLWPLSDAWVVEPEAGGAPVGYALARSFGRGRLIGPLAAPDDATAAAIAGAAEGQFLRIDIPQAQGAFADWLDRAGLAVVARVTRMRIGAAPEPRAQGAACCYAMAAQAFD